MKSGLGSSIYQLESMTQAVAFALDLRIEYGFQAYGPQVDYD
jgi:hypothetical protein